MRQTTASTMLCIWAHLTGGASTIGDNGAQRYVSIDGATDVDYFRFTAGAGTRLNAQLVPLGDVYQQGAVGTATEQFRSPRPRMIWR